jgi:glycosyltransferase involved in cell wall biosynthesis
MHRTLILTYYWPPAGSSGVQRWLKFVKYLREFGWEPIVYTANNPEVFAQDESLFKDIPQGVEVIRRDVPEPYGIYKFFTGNRKKKIGVGFTSNESKKKVFINSLAIWIRGNFFIPDARMLWISPSSRYLSKYLKENPVDLIISTGPPHSMHLIAKRLKSKFSVPWIADFRDPWTNIDFYQELKLTKIADLIHHRLENKVIKTADATVVVSESMAREFRDKKVKRVEVITNGYDHTDYLNEKVNLDDDFTVVYVGTIPPSRNCKSLWVALSRFKDQNLEFKEKFKLRLIGSVDFSVIESLKEAKLFDNTVFDGNKSHTEVSLFQQSAQVLLLLVNDSPNAKGILTGKVFEYLAAKRPILAVGPKGGDLDILLKETGAGVLLPFDSEIEIFDGLKWFWEGYKNNWNNFEPKNVQQYSRQELTCRIAGLMDELVLASK